VSDPLAGLDLARCEALMARAGDGDAEAWSTLVRELWPCLLRLAGSGRGAPGGPEDHAHDVAAGVIEKLGGRDGHGLRQFAPWRLRRGDKTFADWIRIVTKNVVRDRARQQLGPARREGAEGEPSVKRLLNEFAGSPALERMGVRPPMTTAQTARQLVEYARAHLPADQVEALARWSEGASFEDIAAEMHLEEEDGRRLVRAAVATLRRYFAGGRDGSDKGGVF